MNQMCRKCRMFVYFCLVTTNKEEFAVLQFIRLGLKHEIKVFYYIILIKCIHN